MKKADGRWGIPIIEEGRRQKGHSRGIGTPSLRRHRSLGGVLDPVSDRQKA
jgi:hypothetical protein